MSEGVSEEDWSSDETSFLSSSAARGTVNFTPSDEGIQRVQQQTTGSEELQQPKLDINPERKTAQPTSGLAKPAVPGQPTASSAEVKTSGECMAAKADEPEKKSNCGRPDGKFPLHAKGRCSHKDHWSRLRGKRGHAYFFCKYCGLGWRVPRQKSRTDEQAPDAPEE
jgi:hypothetical protein|eukprot:CAMPEP_0174301626 /NCGR_PEP_ID=MMETSP0809-20121228/59156_1 /TAXON_ID=73025 ORGANISM="Eutreptiella gymnastica-like, Strain CCMP1594" /NCGR_SAMPLE_ID=MMETSP0809 /ASSEMBLY_ACC=CAM_ASM_000658 /LENGTH=166 /DNA_ID=CAMNT_0015407405 /DNA_START=215 /DNA_END=715 /DNA_ORIENTATION=-